MRRTWGAESFQREAELVLVAETDRCCWCPLSLTLATSAFCSAAMGDGLYEFEARAVGELGLREEFTGRAEASIIVDAVSPFVTPRAWVPLVLFGE